MSRDRYEEEEEVEEDDRELPDESDMDSFDEPGIMPCPHCRKMVSEEAEVCSHCGEYISAEDAPRKPLPIWFWIALVAGFVALLVMMIR